MLRTSNILLKIGSMEGYISVILKGQLISVYLQIFYINCRKRTELLEEQKVPMQHNMAEHCSGRINPELIPIIRCKGVLIYPLREFIRD